MQPVQVDSEDIKLILTLSKLLFEVPSRPLIGVKDAIVIGDIDRGRLLAADCNDDSDEDSKERSVRRTR